MTGGLHAYQVSQRISEADPPFSALIFAAMRKADTRNSGRLKAAFPELFDELLARYQAPGGKLESDRGLRG